MKISQFCDHHFVQQLIGVMDEAFALCEIIFDQDNVPTDYRFLKVNTAFSKLSNCSSQQLVGKSALSCFGKEALFCLETCSRMAEGGGEVGIDIELSCFGKWVKGTVFSHKSGLFSMILRDMSEVLEAKRINERYRALLEESQDIVLFINQDGYIIDVNAMAIKVYGYTKDELINMTVIQLRRMDQGKLFKSQFNEALEQGIIFETIHRRKDGTEFPVEVSSKSSIVGGEPIIMSIVRDITDRKATESVLKKKATHDELTGIYNRAGFYEKLSELISHVERSGSKFAVLYMDIDHFKKINDTYGHDMGDKILIEFTQKLSRVIRTVDLFGRIGGDEFVIIQAYVETLLDVDGLIKRIKLALKQSAENDIGDIELSASIGISIYPDDGLDVDLLISLADDAMYSAKACAGSSPYCFSIQSKNDK